MPYDHSELNATLQAARERLLAARDDNGHWTGRLSSSALSTATAACAIEFFCRTLPRERSSTANNLSRLVEDALDWIVRNQNADGGWGDTLDSPSNISTTTLCWAALHACASKPDACRESEKHAERWLSDHAGGTTPQQITAAISAAYGDDRSFSTPILAMCAISGRFGGGRDAWREIPALPFELAALPRSWFRYLGLPVVSYALPALIAIGRAIHHHRPTRNPITRLLRALAGPRTLRVLDTIQPESGGFLEAAPLTSFVVMSLVTIGRADHPVAERGIAFLASTVREDGSWPIDTNLATWLTTLSINALTPGGDAPRGLAADERGRLREWIGAQQYQQVHHYTRAAPGGWAWTDLSGGVPDADDTPGALLALRALAPRDSEQTNHDEDPGRCVAKGVAWLLDIQNRDGGIPTFCRGWGKLAFDRSSPDLTAHTLRAWHAWR